MPSPRLSMSLLRAKGLQEMYRILSCEAPRGGPALVRLTIIGSAGKLIEFGHAFSGSGVQACRACGSEGEDF